ncbi:hypothetical protein ABZZ17_20890 [Streptomyces sp. NPDC006512]|uniref:hypothetical protein n=1 Tax=Streptomyces sp. NPDC006512 TaxID=3154307 RepID=UPI0033A2FA72
MIPRTKPVRAAAAALFAAALFLTAGCGAPPEEEGAEAAASDDGGFAAVAAHCEGRGSGAAPVAPDSPGELPADPEARKYAENHAYKQRAGLSDEGKCRGDAHAVRVRKALSGTGGAAGPQNPAELTALLQGLGYPVSSGDVYASGGSGLGFAVWIPETGPCLSGVLGTPARVEAHGVYMEGGCREPSGGH